MVPRWGRQLSSANRWACLLRDGIVAQAKELSPAKRNAILQPLIKDLMETESEARRHAMDFPELAAELGQIAATSEEGARQLRNLL